MIISGIIMLNAFRKQLSSDVRIIVYVLVKDVAMKTICTCIRIRYLRRFSCIVNLVNIYLSFIFIISFNVLFIIESIHVNL